MIRQSTSGFSSPLVAQTHLAKRTVFAIVIAATVGIIPFCFFGYHPGHDFGVQVSSWVEAAQQFRAGNLYPHWAAGANYGFGEPRFIFYPPVSWTIGGVMGLLLPWRMVPGAYVFLAIVTAGLAMWRFASEWLTPAGALFASVIYSVNPYLMVTAYTRCAYGELLASAFFPLLVWATLRIVQDPRRAAITLAVVFALIWLTNFPAGVIATYSVSFLLIIGCWVSRSLRPLWFGSAAIIAGLGAAAFVLLPAAAERRWVNINAVVASMFLPWNNFWFTRNIIPLFQHFSRKISFLSFGLIGATLMATYLARSLRTNASAVWKSLFALSLLAIFLMSPPSRVLWEIAPQLRFVQFPWRWLFPLCTAGAFLAAAAISDLGRNRISWMALVLVLGGIDAAIARTREFDTYTVKNTLASVRSGGGYKGIVEYTPIAARVDNLPKNAPFITLVNDPGSTSSDNSNVQVDMWAADRRVISSDLAIPRLARLKLLAYPSWQATVNGVQANLETDDNGLVLLQLPAGRSRSEIVFGRTRDRTAGTIISLLSVVALAIVKVLVRTQETGQAQEPVIACFV